MGKRKRSFISKEIQTLSGATQLPIQWEKLKVKFSLEQAIKAQRGTRVRVLLFL